MDLYSLSRQWFDWSFENPDLIKPSHTALYLPLRIGYLRFEALQQKRNETVKLTIPEIKDKIEFYRQKIKLIS